MTQQSYKVWSLSDYNSLLTPLSEYVRCHAAVAIKISSRPPRIKKDRGHLMRSRSTSCEVWKISFKECSKKKKKKNPPKNQHYDFLNVYDYYTLTYFYMKNKTKTEQWKPPMGPAISFINSCTLSGGQERKDWRCWRSYRVTRWVTVSLCYWVTDTRTLFVTKTPRQAACWPSKGPNAATPPKRWFTTPGKRHTVNWSRKYTIEDCANKELPRSFS